MIKERDINYEIDMMNKPTRFLQEEKIRKKVYKKTMCLPAYGIEKQNQ